MHKKNFIKKVNSSPISFRAGTVLTFNRIRGEGTISRCLNDIEYIKPKPESDIYIAISLKTGFTALGQTPEEAYSCLIYKLYDSLREVVDFPNAQVGQEVSKELKKESLKGLRMPQDRQMRALLKGIEEFLAVPRNTGSLYLKRIESRIADMITTEDLENTTLGTLDVDILDAIGADEINETVSTH